VKAIVKTLRDAVGSDLLEKGQWVIDAMKRTTGDGTPDNGQRFGQGQTRFTEAGETLQSAVPNDSWDGTGARAYADQNTRQQVRAETMADADHEVHRALFREAVQIKSTRDQLDAQRDILGVVSQRTLPRQFVPHGEAMKLAIEISALQAALGVCTTELYELNSLVKQNATELQQAVGRYAGVADGAAMSGVDFRAPPAARGPGRGAGSRTQPTAPDLPAAPSLSATNKVHARAVGYDNTVGLRKRGSMSDELCVTSAHIRELGAKQRHAAAEIGSATGVVEGVTASLRTTHGVIASATASAVEAVQAARGAAGHAMAAVSQGLADRLGLAATAYDETDETIAGVLDNEMRPRR
jgi:EspA/EspE family/Excreted virulence factor EspC, type VII ESX diderm